MPTVWSRFFGVGLLALMGCSQKSESPKSNSTPPKSDHSLSVIPDSAANTVAPESDSMISPIETLAVEPKLKRVPTGFHVDTLAWVGHVWNWQLPKKGKVPWTALKVNAPESMDWRDGSLIFTPLVEGMIDASWSLFPQGDTTQKNQEGGSKGIPLRFRLHALNPVKMQWGEVQGESWTQRPIPLELKTMLTPRLPWPVTVSIHCDGASVEDTVLILDPKNPNQSKGQLQPGWISHGFTRTFATAGEHTLVAKAWADSVVADTAVLRITTLASVSASLSAPSDTLEPGTKAFFGIGKPTANGAVQFKLDVNGDGVIDWSGTEPAKIPWITSASGHFKARLEITDSKGVSGFSEAHWIVNRKARVQASAKSLACNLVTPCQLKLDYQDPDDTLVAWYALLVDTTGNLKASRDTVKLRTKNAISISHEGTGYIERGWRQPGRYPVKLCAVSSDFRIQCGDLELEIFNAKPTCKIKPPIHPIPGKPILLAGEAQDPDGKLSRYEWDLDGDGRFEWQRDTNDVIPFTFARKGKFPIVYRVTSADGLSARDSIRLEVRAKW